MQTFLPLPDLTLSASVLDRQRLGKQRVECKQIYLALTDPTYGWRNHPAVKMWRGYEPALAAYGALVCREWRARGYSDTLKTWFTDRVDVVLSFTLPPWFGNPAFHLSHRSNLLRKLPSHYRTFWPTDPDNLPYIWPDASCPVIGQHLIPHLPSYATCQPSSATVRSDLSYV